MLTGEYLALDNALVLTLPTKFGQSLEVKKNLGKGELDWVSYTHENKVWFNALLSMDNRSFKISSSSDEKIAKTLIKILQAANDLSDQQLSKKLNYRISTHLDFPQNWGLGSSSTLINNIAEWFNVDPYQLHFSVFNGSGYDIAAAYSNNAITYQINNKKPVVTDLNFNPAFKSNIFFVHLNQKQNSYNEVKKYQENKNQAQVKSAVLTIDKITTAILNTTSLKEFEKLITQHETVLSSILGLPTIKSKLFSDYIDGAIKSLGAWGGDFILVTGNDKSFNYFKKKGYLTILRFNDMVI